MGKEDGRAKRLGDTALGWAFFWTSNSALEHLNAWLDKRQNKATGGKKATWRHLASDSALEPLSNLLEQLSAWLDKQANKATGRKATW
jgi:hypothetical protein